MVAVRGPVDTGVPLVTAPRPWSIEPLPPLNTPVSVVLLPLLMVLAAALNDVMLGGGTTVTVTVAVTETRTELVTVSVKVVVVERGPVDTGVPLVTAPTPWSTVPVPPLNTAVSVVLVPAVMVLAAAVKEVIVGGGTTVALNTTGLPFSPTAVAWSVFDPAAEPRVQFTAAEPASAAEPPVLVSVVTDPTPSIDPPPLLTVNVTATLGTPLPFASITRTVG